MSLLQVPVINTSFISIRSLKTSWYVSALRSRVKISQEFGVKTSFDRLIFKGCAEKVGNWKSFTNDPRFMSCNNWDKFIENHVFCCVHLFSDVGFLICVLWHKKATNLITGFFFICDFLCMFCWNMLVGFLDSDSVLLLTSVCFFLFNCVFLHECVFLTIHRIQLWCLSKQKINKLWCIKWQKKMGIKSKKFWVSVSKT